MDLAAAFEGLRWGAIGSAFGLGLRHGFDWDHVAAITDITGSQDDTRRSLVLSTLYIVGHGVVVTLLGLLAVAAGTTVPGWLDGVMSRVVGATLVALGLWVVVSLVRHGRQVRMRSRWMLAITGARRAGRWLRERREERARPERGAVVVDHEHDHPTDRPHHDPATAVTPSFLKPHPTTVVGSGFKNGGVTTAAGLRTATETHRHPHRHVGSLPDDPFTDYGTGTALGVGMLHGVGAETPTQMVLFAGAAGAATAWAGTLFLLAFVVGLMLSNTAIALASRFGVLSAGRNFAAYATVTVVVAALSLSLGTVLLLGLGEGLPGLFA